MLSLDAMDGFPFAMAGCAVDSLSLWERARVREEIDICRVS
jgi:hypothetical protein